MFVFWLFLGFFNGVLLQNPVVVGTWKFSVEPCRIAWDLLSKGNDAITALEEGASYCERNQCDGTVGFGGSPDENGETTLDALIFDGTTMDMGAVANLRRVKHAISVAKHVLQHTKHSILSGDQATAFAVAMGFKEETLSTKDSTEIWEQWKQESCQPNFWKNVEPSPSDSCGPYTPIGENSVYFEHGKTKLETDVGVSHDTIGMVTIDVDGRVVAGTSTNGARHKIPGRVGDSPIPGAGAYADDEVGGATATGDGDTMLRFLPSFLAIEEMRRGSSPDHAAKEAVARITKHYPEFSGAVIAVNKLGNFGAACNNIKEFPFVYMKAGMTEPEIVSVSCTNPPIN